MLSYQELRSIIDEACLSKSAGDRERALGLLTRAKRLALRSKNREWLSEVENAFANFHCRFSDFESELRCRRRSVALLGAKGHPLKLAVARRNLGGALTTSGEFVEAQLHLYRALDYFTQGLPEYSLIEHLKQEEAKWVISVLYGLANLHINLRDYEASREYLKLLAQIETKFGLARFPDAVGLDVICAYEIGDYESCLRHASEQLELSRAQNDAQAEAMALSALALVALKQGRAEQARCFNNEALRIAIAINDMRRTAELLCNIAELEMHEHKIDAALTVLDQAASKLDGLRTPSMHERLHRLTSEAFEAKKEYEAALHHFKLATQFKERMFDTSQQHEVARVRQIRMRRALAEEKKLLLKRLNDVAREKAKPISVDVHQLLQLAPTLSRTELKVCELLTLGATTKEIAGQLSASRHTIDGHRTAIRKKLGLAPTVNLSTWLMKQQCEVA